MNKMGCKVLCPSVALLAYLMICEHVRAECTPPSFASRNVVLTANHLSTQSFSDGSTVTFECVIGHKPVNLKASRSVTCEQNQWTSLELSCTRKSCGSLADFLNGRYDMTGNLFGDTAKPVCHTGYMLAGKETTRTCRDQGWDGRDPLCEPVKCSAPPALENGQLQDEPLDSYDYLDAVSYRCNTGLNLIGQSTLHCSEDGTFKPDLPKCFDGCPVPTIPNAKRIGGKSPPYKLGNFIEYKCEDGYTLNGDASIVCKANGWSPEPPQCIALPTTPEISTPSKAPKENALPTTPEISTPSKAPKENGDATSTPAGWVVALIVIVSAVLIGLAVFVVLRFKKNRSKHSYSDKVATNNRDDPL
ncbi:membrane cofactor protein-like isoform X2 [Sinocyclocheilus grahami]|uniref:membrane cofactor protein-like isoform X2 n=1 Tax=Sinocyclocheilus grahami TaxID=75366 RepID=UPI0007ACDCFD|nr:PREDICTED: membrane cofactor protein-like isoform X2 [Sinocyclocheilus grahami]